MTTSIESFAEKLMQEVREIAVDSCQFLTEPGVSGAAAERWRSLLTDEAVASTVRAVIPDVVDLTLFALLDAIDTERLLVFWKDGPEAPVEDLGEIGGGDTASTFIYPEGWRSRFATTRWNPI